MKKHNLAFIDVETTGLDPLRHEIIELGCVVVEQKDRPGRGPELIIKDELEYKIKPQNIEVADPQALRINGYNEGDWLFAADLPQVMTDFADKVRSATFVAHNVAFDWPFIEQAFRKAEIANPMHYAKLDTVSIAFARLYHRPEVQKFSLRALCEHFDIKNEKAHTALADAKATLAVYQKLFELQGDV
ncbi:MAG: 3'-5' exonuclease [Candidatus Paceibacterota bacterium]